MEELLENDKNYLVILDYDLNDEVFEEAHSRYHATLESAVNKWAAEKEAAVARYRATLDATATKWVQEKALADTEAGVAYRRKLEGATKKWNEEKAQKELQTEIEGVVFKKKKAETPVAS